MKKGMLSKLFAGTIAVVMAFGFMPTPVSADETQAEAYLAYAEKGYNVQYWNNADDNPAIVSTKANVTGPGQYTVGLDFTGVENGFASGVEFTGLMVKNGETLFPGNTLTIDSMKVNGTEITLGKTYTSSDDQKETRINLYNVWVTEIKDARNGNGDIDGVTATPVNVDDLAEVKTIEVTFTMAAGDGTAVEAAEEAEEVFEIPSEFTAFMMFSSLNGNWENYDPIEGKNTVKVLGDGRYSVTLKGEDIGAKGDADQAQVFVVDIIDMGKAMAQLGVKYNTHLEGVAQEPEVQVEIEVLVDGTKVSAKSSKVIFGDTEENGRFRIEIYNTWGAHSGLILEDPPVMAEAICPAEEITVNFKLTGTGLNTEAAAAAEAELVAAEEAAKAEEEAKAAEAAKAEEEAKAAEEAAKAEEDAAAAEAAAEAATAEETNWPLIIGIIVAVVVIAAVIVVVLRKKKK